jgi:CDP-diacylglycerol--serine O-phosphatidyltransferase
MLALAQPVGFHPRVLWVAAALYVVCTVLRLARFNVEPDEDHKPGEFSGLPSPAAAAVVASFPIMLFGPQLMSDGERGAAVMDDWVTGAVPVVTFAVACLMVSRVRYPHVFRQVLRGRRSGPYLIKLVFGVAVVVAVPRVAIPLLACWYAFATPAVALWNRHLRPAITGPANPPPAQPAPPPAAPPAPTGERWRAGAGPQGHEPGNGGGDGRSGEHRA